MKLVHIHYSKLSYPGINSVKYVEIGDQQWHPLILQCTKSYVLSDRKTNWSMHLVGSLTIQECDSHGNRLSQQ